MQNITGYFSINKEHYNSKSKRFLLMPNNDVLAIDELANAVKIYEDIEKIILHVAMSGNQIEKIQTLADETTVSGLENILDISGVWLGFGRQDIFNKYPELDGVKTYTDTETGGVFEQPIVRLHSWGGI